MLSHIDEDSFIQYSITRNDIESLNIANLKKFISRITRNEKLTLAVQGKLYIATYGYEHDSREVHQIPEIQRWATVAREEVREWYLCAGVEGFSTLKWIATCTYALSLKPFKRQGGRVWVETDPEQIFQFMLECLAGLNIATDKWGWSAKYNYEISRKIQIEIFPNISVPELEK